jgi:hypothetical protein
LNVAIDYHLNAGVFAFATAGRLSIRDSTFAGNQLAAVNVQTNNPAQSFSADVSHSLLWQNGAGLGSCSDPARSARRSPTT